MIIDDMDAAHFERFWAIFRDIVRARETYAFDPGLSFEAARRLWLETPSRTFVALDGDQVLGSYYLRPNASGPGDHVCNCGYMVDRQARGRGVASALCDHSQDVARALGFRAMQFNAVVSTNTGAVRLWQRHGFEIVGTLPEAFRHATAGYVDTHVMYKRL